MEIQECDYLRSTDIAMLITFYQTLLFGYGMIQMAGEVFGRADFIVRLLTCCFFSKGNCFGLAFPQVFKIAENMWVNLHLLWWREICDTSIDHGEETNTTS